MKLKIAPDLALDADVAGEAIAILAKRGAGKTNTATVLVEELYDAGVQTVILDPVGAWWGIRSTAAGKSEGLAVPILGGQYGDVPLEHTAGALIADVVVDTGQSLLLDLSDFPSKTTMARFVVDFGERLFRRKARAQSLVHLVLEEADTFAPQGGKADDARMRGAVEQIVRRGRSRGLGITMVTQRSAVLNKDVLSQADILIAMRTTSPHDRKAIELWVDAHADDELGVIDSLPSLETGEAWIWNPERALLKRAKIRRRRTFDSSATPKAGERRVEPREHAPIDLEALGEEMRATAERAEASDPKKLQARIRELERELRERSAGEPTVERVEVPVEVPVVSDEDVAALDARVDDLRELAGDFRDLASRVGAAADQLAAALGSATTPARAGRPERAASVPAPSAARTSAPGARNPAPRPALADRHARAEPVATALAEEVKLGKGERTVLDVLAEYPEGRTYNELAFLAGYSAKASTLGVILSNLRKAGLVEPGNQPVRPTAEGLKAAGGVRERPTGQELLNQWLHHPRMGEGERRVLLELVDLYPDEPTHDELCERTGYSSTASTMGVILSKLRKLGLVEKGARRVAAEFYEAIS